ncbi:MAG TPA: DUF1330 domain-containing protein [Gammaproteobacteria bacterium]|jgi:uncharacterized protein (DUF1330 family)
MSAYIIVDVEITDRASFDEYAKSVPPTLVVYGGRFLARGGKTENLEGAWQPKRVVIIEFETYERAKQWWASEEYRAPKEMRQRSAITDMIVVAGV